MKKLIKLYCAICHHSQDSRIAEKMQHGSNNKSAQFTDVELMTAYLWGAQQGLLTRNPTKNLWYHGVKLHVFAQLRPHRLPVPCAVQISKASLCDLWAAKQIDLDCAPVTDGRLYADRAYIDAEWRAHLQSERNITLITPRKRKKYDTLVSEDAASTHVSGIRQPIEAFFNWLQAKTHIQSASHVRSCAGLLFHIFSALAFAALLLQFNY